MIPPLASRSKFRKSWIWDEQKLTKGNYIVIILHRPGNVDGKNKIENLLYAIIKASGGIPIIFPVHPRTTKIIASLDFNNISHLILIHYSPFPNQIFQNLHFTEPLDYLEFNYLIENAKVVITDSCGITEETTVLGIPYTTIRDNAERHETVTISTNELISTDPFGIKFVMKKTICRKMGKRRNT